MGSAFVIFQSIETLTALLTAESSIASPCAHSGAGAAFRDPLHRSVGYIGSAFSEIEQNGSVSQLG